jgi:tRNA A-37 threonylcarbamoyl transferase component Bud32
MVNNELFAIESGQINVVNFERSSLARFNLPQRFFPVTTNIIAHNGIIYVTSTAASVASVLTLNTRALLRPIAVPVNIQAIQADDIYWTVGNQIRKLNLLTNELTQLDFFYRPEFQSSSEIYHLYTFVGYSQLLLYNAMTGAYRMIHPPINGIPRGNSDNHVVWRSSETTLNFYNIALDTWTATEIPEAANLQPAFLHWDMIFFPFNNRNAILGVNMDTAERIWIDTDQASMVVRAETKTQLFFASFRVPSTQVVIYNHTSNSFSIEHLSNPRANVKTLVTSDYVLFGEGNGENGDPSTRIDIYKIGRSPTWHSIDMPQHYLGELLWVAVGQSVYLFRAQRVDMLNLTSLTFTQLSLPVDIVTQARVRGSKIIISSRNSYMIYETTTGEWLYATNPAMTQHRVSSSFVVIRESLTSQFLVAKRFTTALNAISDRSIFRGQSHDFSAEISGPLSRAAWKYEQQSIPDQDTPTLRLTNVTEAYAGRYTVELFDLCNQRMRQEATLVVNGPPDFISKLVDTVSLCHDSTTLELSTVGRNVSYSWSINGVAQSTVTGTTLFLAPYQLSCGSSHRVCMTATNAAGSAKTCADLKLVEYETIFNGPRPMNMQRTWFSQMTVILQVDIFEEDCTNHTWLLDGQPIGQPFVNVQRSTQAVLLTTDSAGRRFTVKAQCGSATAESTPFIFESVSNLTVPLLVVSIVVTFLVLVGAFVAGIVFRRKLLAKQVKEVELQSLLTQAKSESLSRDAVSVIPSTTWEWQPSDDFTYCPLDSLPGKINVSTPNVSKEPVKVDVWTQYEVIFYAPPSSIFRSKKKYSLLSDKLTNGVRIDLYSPQSPKYEIKVEPVSFLLEEDKQLNVTISVKMRMTAKCKICLVVVFDQQKIYSAVEFKLASAMSTWIDLAEIEMTGEHLGGGGFGSVSRGSYRGQEVAVKRLLSQYMSDDMHQEFEREVMFVKDMRHPNIVQFIGASNVKEHLAIVIEYAPMGSLFSVMQKNKLTNSMKIIILLEIAKALQFLHLNRIIHRDIKPQNILVFSLQPKTPVHIKLTDFGTSRFISEDVMTVTKNVGTISYMAPEALGKNPRIDQSADVYSFAILMWEVMYEQQPFSEFEWQSDIEMHIKSGKRLDLERKTEVQLEIVELIKDCWHQDPAQRPLVNNVVQRLSALM